MQIPQIPFTPRGVGKTVWTKLTAPCREFMSFNRDTIRYMAMHWIGGGLLIYETILPAFMDLQGISVLEAGILFSLASILDVILTYVLSKFFDRISPNVGMALDWLTESIPPLIYGFATTMGHFLLGRVAGRITNILNPVYQVYENEVYPEERRSLIYSYHLITPHIFTILVYPLIGYLLAYVFPSAMAFRVVFWTCGAAFLFVAIIPWKGIRWVEPVRLSYEKVKAAGRFTRDLYLAGAAEVMLSVGLGLSSGLVTSYFILDKLNGNVFHLIMLEVFEAVIGLVAGLFTRNWSKRMPEEWGAIYGTVFMACYAFIMIFARNYYMILLAFTLLSVGDTLWFPNHCALMMRKIPRDKQGLFFGKLSSLKKLLSMLLPGLTCYLASYFGFFVPFTLAFGSLVAVCIFYRLLINRNQPAEFSA